MLSETMKYCTCGDKIAWTATSCPTCGKQYKGNAGIIAVAIIIGAILLVITILYSQL